MFTLQSFKEDTLAADITDSATSATLTTGAFGTPTGEQMLVIDYDVAAKREIVKCAIDGTAVTSIDRAQDGTSAVAHSSGAKVLMAFVPSHYANGLGSIGANDAWTAWTPTPTGFSGTPTVSGSYIQLGKIVILSGYVDGTSNANTLTITNLPVAPKYNLYGICSNTKNSDAFPAEASTFITVAGANLMTFYLSNNRTATSWGTTGNKVVGFNIVYEAE